MQTLHRQTNENISVMKNNVQVTKVYRNKQKRQEI